VQGVTRIVLDSRDPAPTIHDLKSGKVCWRRTDGIVTVSAAFLGLIADLTSAAQEQLSELRDKHDRVPASENAMVQGGAERDLVLQQVAARFGHEVAQAAGSRPVRLLAPWPGGHRWAAGLSHDLDVVALWPLFTGLRLTELVRHREWRRAARTLTAAGASAFGDPVTRGIGRLLEHELRTGLHSTWFMLCGTPTLGTFTAGDLTYRPESPRAIEIFKQVRDAGHEIGLHGSFETSRRPAAFGEQARRLAGLSGAPATGVRQHFVRLRPGGTHLEMAEAGFVYDASMGFADRNGFRLGLADVVPAWSAVRGESIGLDLVPFAWMDRTLSKYSGIENPETWIADGLELAGRCRAVEGLWAGIWHPNLVPALGFPDGLEAYESLLRGLARERPWFATHQQLVQWRRARRAARAVGVDAQGRVSARAPHGGAHLQLESPDGTSLEPVETGA